MMKFPPLTTPMRQRVQVAKAVTADDGRHLIQYRVRGDRTLHSHVITAPTIGLALDILADRIDQEAR